VATAQLEHRADSLAQLRAENELLRRDVERYRRTAERDPVTGMFSRAHFEWRLEHEWTRARTFWTPLSLLSIGVEGLAEAREQLHARAALELLRTAATVLSSGCRAVDVVCRVAEDAFAVILPHTNRTGAEAVTQRLEALWSAATLPSSAFTVDAAITPALAVAFDEAESPLELVLRAEESLMRARRRRRGQAERPTDPHLARPTWIDAA
jgi:diguanylate cyclase (GGDEF)-like protein